jgi:hypothetical protein
MFTRALLEHKKNTYASRNNKRRLSDSNFPGTIYICHSPQGKYAGEFVSSEDLKDRQGD